MTIYEFAKRFDNREHGGRLVSKDDADLANSRKWIIAYGESDDLLELRGYADDEIGAYRGTSVIIGAKGYVIEKRKNEKELIEQGWIPPIAYLKIVAEWCGKANKDGWFISAEPLALGDQRPQDWAAPFDVMEEGKLFCRGLVIDLSKCIPQ